MLGDLVVSRNSAWAHPGAGTPVRFPPESYRQIGGINHFSLTGHPIVLAQLVEWLGPHPQLPASPSVVPAGGGAQRP